MSILRCIECGNSFKTEQVKEGDLVSCPICEARYEVHMKEGKIKLVDFIYEQEDLGELLIE